MGYAKERAEKQRKVKRIKRIVFGIVSVLLVGFCVLAVIIPPDNWKFYISTPSVASRNAGELRVHFIDVGQGDATLIEFPDGKTALIDTGNGSAESDKSLLRHLNALSIGKIDYLILTHLDADHIGGVDELLDNKKIGKAFLPVNIPSKTDDYDYATLEYKLTKARCEYTVACPASQAHLETDLNGYGDYRYTFAFVYPTSSIVDGMGSELLENTNETSINIWLDYQGVSFLFTGDSDYAIENKICLHATSRVLKGVDLSSTEILKVAHHGADGSTGKSFLEFLQVKTAVISCGEENIYKHPHEEVCKRIKDSGAELFSTDKNGTVLITAKANGTYSVATLGK